MPMMMFSQGETGTRGSSGIQGQFGPGGNTGAAGNKGQKGLQGHTVSITVEFCMLTTNIVILHMLGAFFVSSVMWLLNIYILYS